MKNIGFFLFENQDILLIFKENKIKVANSNIQFKSINSPTTFSDTLMYSDILETFEKNKFLILPKLTTSKRFNELCSSWTKLDLKYAFFSKINTRLKY
jgi:hypothetical protein